jgi:2-keto-4-pentenoate hydratase/2-oxohepta-3-ene-1,7-dioic acid hydratase in catechol pathway
MRLATVEVEGASRVAVIAGDTAQVLPRDVEIIDLLGLEACERERRTRRIERELPLAGAALRAPLKPPTIRDFSVFEQHIEGVIKDSNPRATVPPIWYESPFCYFTNPHALTGHRDQIAVPPGCGRLDFELEIAAIIGRSGANLTPDQAVAHIAGYTIFNDWSARDLQAAEMQLGLGICKGKDFANTLGPWIVTADELEPYMEGDRLDLELRAEINGTELGRDSLANMAWSFPELVSYASRGTWVRPGDVLGSGTCGNGCLLELWGRRGRDTLPPLGPGDVVSLHAQAIGTLTNQIVSGAEPHALPTARLARKSIGAAD